MTIKLDQNTPQSLATLFTFLLTEGITPDQLMVGIIRLAIDTHDSPGINSSVGCLRCLIGQMPIDASAEGVTEFIAALAAEGVTTLMALNALAVACDICGLIDSVAFIRISYRGLKARTSPSAAGNSENQF
ncbi:hypothetical protein [Cylindrospermum sp. FACHB-282]|uniref:hypothetical protein n=1 Tax=Cylindrospermum sp. FACHB-282 TaxID=2692794 RepID=UPI001686237B|nr:hypothetical protein [Cylindrospermum sp. FACHB-282]MBD2386580.1 hypothetical protein [Cylindrospermum sp. FACHB-282]